MPIALGSLGRTAEARVRRALKFHELDLSRLSERDRHRAWAMLLGWQRGRPDPEQGPRPAQDGVPEAQQALRECIEALANGEPDMLYMDGETKYALWPALRRRPGTRRSGNVTITTDYASPAGRPVTQAVGFAFVNDLKA